MSGVATGSMDSAQLAPALWLMVFQLILYGVSWALCGALLGEDKAAVMHWGLFLLLMALAAALAVFRSEPRSWWAFNGAALLTLLAFASMRRGFECFLRAPSSDNEQLVMLALVGGAVASLGTGPGGSAWRVVLTFGAQAYTMVRLLMTAYVPVRSEFGRTAQIGMLVPGLLLAGALLLPPLQQLTNLDQPREIRLDQGVTASAIATYLFAAALFNTGFMMLLMQRLLLGLHRSSRRDPLTGLENRGAIDATLGHLWAQATRGGEGFAVLLIDVDHFKRINDAHGHAVGDQVLEHVASVIAAQARQADTVGRYGGDEFIIVAPQSTLAGAVQAAERLRLGMEAEHIHARASNLRVTLSIGVASSTSEDLAVADVLARADRALYRAKARGRNRVESQGD
jgi:diguanylate cyclase (GGDEF)-like protein